MLHSYVTDMAARVAPTIQIPIGIDISIIGCLFVSKFRQHCGHRLIG